MADIENAAAQAVGTGKTEKRVFLSFVGNSDPWSGPKFKLPEQLEKYKEYLCGIKTDSDLLHHDARSLEESMKNEGPILSLYEELKPDIIYLFPSCKPQGEKPNETEKEKRWRERPNSTEWRAEWVRNILMHRYPAIRKDDIMILPLIVEDATDFEQLSEAFNKNIAQLRKNIETPDDEGKYEYCWNSTSGTPQMSAVGYVFADRGGLPGIKTWQCKDPGRQDRIREINTGFITESVCKDRIKKAMEHMDFISIMGACQEIIGSPIPMERKKIPEFLRRIFDAYHYMDTFFYKGALDDPVKNIDKDPAWASLSNEYQELVRKQCETWKQLWDDNTKETPENLVDVYFSMCRADKRRAYTSVLTRFRRLVEGTLYYRLEHTLGIDPRRGSAVRRLQNQGRHNLQALQHDIKQGHRIEIYDGLNVLLNTIPTTPCLRYMFCDDFDFYEPLAALALADLRAFFGQDGRGASLLGRRNQTPDAHGMQGTDKQDARDCLDHARTILHILVPETITIMKDYPFSEENIKKWLKLL